MDIRLILSDEKYRTLGLGDPNYPHHNAKWVALCRAFSALGKEMTGLPIDFQIQEQTTANAQFPKEKDNPRSCIGIVPWRMKENKS